MGIHVWASCLHTFSKLQNKVALRSVSEKIFIGRPRKTATKLHGKPCIGSMEFSNAIITFTSLYKPLKSFRS